jgi:hypothetical protein
MRKIFAHCMLLLLATAALGQDEEKIETNSLMFKSFEQKNGFCRSSVSFNYYRPTLGYSFDFFINRSFSIDVAFDGVYSFDEYYTGLYAGVKYWPKRISSTNKLYPFLGIGLSEGKGARLLIENRDYLHFPVGVRYFFNSGLQVTYHLNISSGIFSRDSDYLRYLYSTLAFSTIGIGWRF